VRGKCLESTVMAFVERLGGDDDRRRRAAATRSAPVATPSLVCDPEEATPAENGHPVSDGPAIAGRRVWGATPGYHVIACVDVQPASEIGAHPERLDVLWRLAIRRMERCVRPEDKMCMLGGARIAVCLGSGGQGIAPSALGRRLARAMGDHLAVGTAGLDLRVAVGIGAASGDVESSELAAAAMATIRETTARARTFGTAPPRPFVAVTHVPDRLVSFLAGAHNGSRPGTRKPMRRSPSWPPHRLVRRVLVPLIADGDVVSASLSNSEAWQPPLAGDTSPLWASGLRVLLVDPEPGSDNTPRPMVDAVAAVARRAGAQPIVASALDPDGVLLNLYLTEPDVVVIVLQALGSRSDLGPHWGRAWERPAQLARALRDVGVPVVALGMGASAAALAVCVEQGAVGLFHSDLLPQELARLAAARSNASNSGTPAVRDEPRGPGQLPAPYDALVHLTPSERRVLFHMMEGSSASEIADMLVVSLTTVRSHIRSILRKLNVNSQLAAVALAFGTLPRQASTA